jgi:hypothetical protein
MIRSTIKAGWPARALLAGLALTAGLAGCGGPQTKATAEAPPVNLSGFPPAFREGYADGCNTARGSAKQDAARMKTDGSYAQGYQDGLAGCKRR